MLGLGVRVRVRVGGLNARTTSWSRFFNKAIEKATEDRLDDQLWDTDEGHCKGQA